MITFLPSLFSVLSPCLGRTPDPFLVHEVDSKELRLEQGTHLSRVGWKNPQKHSQDTALSRGLRDRAVHQVWRPSPEGQREHLNRGAHSRGSCPDRRREVNSGVAWVKVKWAKMGALNSPWTFFCWPERVWSWGRCLAAKTVQAERTASAS